MRPRTITYGFASSALFVATFASAEVPAVAPEPPPPADAVTNAPSADPSAGVQSAYRDVVTRAIVEFDAKRFAEARSLFLRAHELWPSARTLRTLGMTAFELRMYPRALEELQAALDDPRRPLPDDQRASVRSLVERTLAFVGRYRVQLSPPVAELLVDGAPHDADGGALVLAIGEHTLVARAKGYETLQRTLVVQGREDDELTMDLETPRIAESAPTPTPSAVPAASASPSQAPLPVDGPVERPGPNRVAAFTALGVGAAGFLAGGVFAGLALKDKGELDGAACPQQECPPPYHSKNDEMHRFANFATAGAVVGILGVGIGSYFLFTKTPRAAQRTARLTPWVGLGSAGVTGKF